MKSVLSTLYTTLYVVLGIMGLLLLIICLWNFERKINYSISYSNMVQKQINVSMDKHIKQYHNKKVEATK